MVNAFGYYASAKGMVLVPSLSGLTRTAAITAIQNANLIYVDGGSTSTTNSALDDIVASQLPNAGDLVEYGSNVSFIYYDFVSAPPFFPPFFPYFPFFPFFPNFPTVQVPNIVGQTISAASSILSNAGLSLGSSTGTTTSGATAENNGKIATQSPAAGTSVSSGTSVDYTTYSYVLYYCRVVEQGVDQGTLAPSSTDQTLCVPGIQAILCSTTAYPTLAEVNAYCNTGSGGGTPPFFPPFFPYFPFFPFFPPFFPYFPFFPFFPATWSCRTWDSEGTTQVFSSQTDQTSCTPYIQAIICSTSGTPTTAQAAAQYGSCSP